MNLQAITYYYRQFRTMDGDPLGRPALAAWNSAHSHIHFRDRLSADVKAHKARSKAAKKGWKKRRAAA